MTKGKRQPRTTPTKLFVFAQNPISPHHQVIPVLAASRDEAIRILEADPRRLGKTLTPKVIAGRPGVTDGQRDFVIFDDQNDFMQFLAEHLDE